MLVQRHSTNEQTGNKSGIQCYHCKKFGHVKADYWYEEKQVNFAEKNDEENKLFMNHYDTNEVASNVWFLDNGYSNHMSGMKTIFKELDETQKNLVKLGDNKDIQVEGKGTVAIKTSNGKVKLIHDVQYVPSLAHNLLSVGQLIGSGYSILFDDGACVIKDKKSGQTMVNIHMTKNKMFPLEVSNVENLALVVDEKNDSKLWHLRYGHLNFQGLQLLGQKGMVRCLSKINSFDLCEGCIYGKHSRRSFPIEKAWKESTCLELIHDDLCGPMNTKSFGGIRYFLHFIDDFSHMSWVYFFKIQVRNFGEFHKIQSLGGEPKWAIH